MPRLFLLVWIILGLGCVCFPPVLPQAHAHQAIINLPSADLTPTGQYFLMNESYIRPWNPGASWKTTNFFAYGLNDFTELSVITYNAGLPETENFTVAYGFKSVVPVLKERYPLHEFKLTGGYMLPVSKQGLGVGSYGFAHVSGRLPRLRTRLTAGVTAGTRQIFDRDMVAFMGAVEQPLTRELSLVLEYYSGTHAFGGAVAGVVYHNHRYDWVLVGGWRIPNNEQSGEPGVVLEVGKFFGPFRSNEALKQQKTHGRPEDALTTAQPQRLEDQPEVALQEHDDENAPEEQQAASYTSCEDLQQPSLREKALYLALDTDVCMLGPVTPFTIADITLAEGQQPANANPSGGVPSSAPAKPHKDDSNGFNNPAPAPKTPG